MIFGPDYRFLSPLGPKSQCGVWARGPVGAVQLGYEVRQQSGWSAVLRGLVLLAPLVFIQAWPVVSSAALPKRLVLALDGVAYRDMKALQEGVTYEDLHGRRFHRQAFHKGYYPVSRMISTFPSASDVAWTEMLGDRPLPGYQRTYFSQAANQEVFQNGVTTTMEYERQMTWQVTGGFLRTLGYVYPRHTFAYEVHELVRHFLKADNQGDTYYALLRSTDDAQHLSADILAMLCTLDEKLQKLRSTYRAREGRELEILILSDHGNNHAGPAKRVEIVKFLEQAGYRTTNSIRSPKDVVLPTAGIESWVEIHNAPSETEALVQLLSHLEGVDLLTAQDPNHAHRFIVMNSIGARAFIDWEPARNAFRYSPDTGDPIHYRPVLAALSRKGQLDAEGFARADAWMPETLTHMYPLAPERIVRGHTRAALNPATILISLNNAYVHSTWFIKKGSEFVRFGGTHGALDALNSNGILLSSFAPTRDTSANRVAALYDGFKGLRDYRAEEKGAEWVCPKAQALTAITRTPFDRVQGTLPDDGLLLRLWNSHFTRPGIEAPMEVTLRKAQVFLPAQVRRGDPQPVDASEQHLVLDRPASLPDRCSCERLYLLPADLSLQPQTEYLMSGRVRNGKSNTKLFSFTFRTDRRGRPIVY